MTIIKKTKTLFLQMVKDYGSDPYNLTSHVQEVEKWARFMLKRYPEANEEIVLLAVWLHDTGHFLIPKCDDHAVGSEQAAREFLLKEEYPHEKMKEVLHCVRAHRCSDIMPETLEAKIIAFIDSASHMTDSIYFKMSKDDKENRESFRAYAKMERDLRDLSAFPEVQKELIGLINAWKKLIQEYEKIDLE